MRTDHMNLIHKLSFNIGERWKSKHSLHSIQTWPSHLLQPQVHSAGWWLLRYYPHQEIPNKTHKRVKTLKLFNPVVWICVWQTYRAVLLLGTHTLKHQLFSHNYLDLEIATITFTNAWAGVEGEKKKLICATVGGAAINEHDSGFLVYLLWSGYGCF